MIHLLMLKLQNLYFDLLPTFPSRLLRVGFVFEVWTLGLLTGSQ